MKCVILCAGDGTRLRPLTETTPKPLVQVGSTELLYHSLEYAEQVGVSEYHLVVGYKKDQVISEIGSQYNGTPVKYHTQENRNGLAHGVNQVDVDFTDNFLLLLADIVYGSFPATQLQDNTDQLTLVTDTVPPETAHQYGVCKFGPDGAVCDLIEKPDAPPSNVVLAGSYILPPDIQEYCSSIDPSDRGEYEITDAIAAYMDTTESEPVLITPDTWRVDIATQSDIVTAEKKLSDKPMQTV